MWPFRNSRKDAATISDLRQRLDQAEDAYTSLVQAKGAAETAMRNMQKPLTDDGLNQIAKEVTERIADIYASNTGGVKARDAAVYAVIHATVREATRGEKYWNTGLLAAEAYREIV